MKPKQSKIIEGTIRWFDNTSGEGMVSATDGNSYYLHWSAVIGKFPAANGKDRQVTLESGWKIKFRAYGAMVAKLKIVAKVKPRKQPSMYIRRDEMKAKLTATYASFDEIFPQTTMDWDKYHLLSNKNKLTTKEEKQLKELEAERDRHNAALRIWNNEKNAVVVSIYREHSRFPLLNKVAQ